MVLCVKLFLELFVSSALHYGKQGEHHPHVLQRFFLVFSDSSVSLQQEKFGEIYFSNTLILVKKDQNVHKSAFSAPEMNVRLAPLSFP